MIRDRTGNGSCLWGRECVSHPCFLLLTDEEETTFVTGSAQRERRFTYASSIQFRIAFAI